MVQYCSRLLRVMLDVSASMTVQTATELQWHTLNNSSEAQKLVFNKSLFSRDRIYARVPPWAKKILEKPPDSRTETDCRKLHALLRGLKSFDRFTEKIQLSMCRSFSYESVDAKRVILRKGHVGVNFYFIYSGSVFVNVEDVNAKGEKFIKTEVTLTKGDSFGELALLRDIKRTASIACRENCELLCVDKDVFARLCPKIFEKELDDKVSFLSCLPLFHQKQWTNEQLRNICFEAQIQQYKTNKVVVSDSVDDEWIYICIEGKCRIIKCLALNEDYTPEKRALSESKEDISVLTSIPEVNKEELLKRKLKNKEENDTPEPKTAAAMTIMELREILKEIPEDDERFTELSQMSRDLEAVRYLLEGDTFGEALRQEAEYPEQHKDNKARMLNSMALDYVETMRKEASNKEKLQEKNSLFQKMKGSLNENKSSKVVQGVVSFNALMSNQIRQAENEEYVYLDIATLSENEVFDLDNILQYSNHHSDDRPKPKSSIILVSSGAKLLRVRRGSYFAYASQEAVDVARTIATTHSYPTDDVLINSYRQKSRWDAYKHTVINTVVEPLLDQSRRKYLSRYMVSSGADKKKQALKLLSSLRKNKSATERPKNDDIRLDVSLARTEQRMKRGKLIVTGMENQVNDQRYSQPIVVRGRRTSGFGQEKLAVSPRITASPISLEGSALPHRTPSGVIGELGPIPEVTTSFASIPLSASTVS
ncbi:cyclic nucleotide-binding domain-containing protein 2-like [Lineus longissimus]|uniref:cyclic nucleotide-binding domain-containing protein 2-like n=1 Tax=Lineus longissimus TaxID=88925 RepID=UPI002B4EAA94